MVPSTTSCGVRRYFSRPRLAMPRVLGARLAEGWTGGAMLAMSVSSLVSGRRVAGQRQEDLVQGRRAQGQVLDRDLGRVQGGEGVAEPVGAGLDGHADPAGGLLDLGLAVVHGGQRRR